MTDAESPDAESPDADLVVATAHAAGAASRDAATAARSAAATSTAAGEAVSATSAVAASAQHATARTVAAAAYAAAEIAAGAAVAVQGAAAARAVEVAASAVAALEKVTAELPADVDSQAACRIAAAVASVVAADVVSLERLTDDAAARVAEAVAVAATAAALAAVDAAAKVEVAAGMAESTADRVAGASTVAEAATDVALESSLRVEELASRQAAQLSHSPVVMELQEALDQGELRLHYQAMFDITSGAVVGMEALLRWQHPTRGLLFPSDFLEVAEGPHLVLPVGEWVLRAAVTQATRWRKMLGAEAPVVWANISCDQLGRQGLPELVGGLLAEAGLPAGSLGIEVTERQLAGRMEDVTTDLRELRTLGVMLAVDDFGTGYASLEYLRRFTFDELKIDGSFVFGIGRNSVDTAVAASIITLGRSLGLSVVGEGVETREQLTCLRELGCSVAQGYLLHRPDIPEQGSELLLSGADRRTDQLST